MLIAKDGQNKVIDLTSTTWTKEELNELKKTKKFFLSSMQTFCAAKSRKSEDPAFCPYSP